MYIVDNIQSHQKVSEGGKILHQIKEDDYEQKKDIILNDPANDPSNGARENDVTLPADAKYRISNQLNILSLNLQNNHKTKSFIWKVSKF